MTAIQKQDPNTLGGFLELRKPHLAQVLPKSIGLTAEKLIKLALLATKKNPALSRCTMDSVFQALLHCAELGLDPGGATGEAHLVPYGDTCQLIIGYRGFITLARRSGVLKQIETHVVRTNDKFTLRYGLNPVLEHEPTLRGDPGDPLVVYCVARLADGAVHVEVMTVPEVNKIRDAALSKIKDARRRDQSPWVTSYEEMARKTVVRRAAKYLPLSPEMQRAIEIDEGEVVDGQLAKTSDTSQVTTPKTQNEKVKQLIRGSTSKVVDVQPGETEEQAAARVSDEPPPPTDEFAPSTSPV
jgi:recombination protein RecT